MFLEERAQLSGDGDGFEGLHIYSGVRDRSCSTELLPFEDAKAERYRTIAQACDVHADIESIAVAHGILKVSFDTHNGKADLEFADEIRIRETDVLHKDFFSALKVVKEVRVIDDARVVYLAKGNAPSRFVGHRKKFTER